MAEQTKKRKIGEDRVSRHFTKKKMGLFFGYKGTRFSGLQINPDVLSIEQVLEEAIYKAGGISEDNHGDLKKVSWNRAARTDKGVHALANVVALKMNPETTVDEINAQLPEDIRAFKIERVAKSFHSKNMCSSRFYVYLCPSYLFKSFADPCLFATQDYDQLVQFKCSADTITRVNSILSKYVGTLNYHNFTTRKNPKDPSCYRYIMSFECQRALEVDGVEFLELVVHGQSFMMHQIRKMVGTMLAVYHNFISIDEMSVEGLFSLKVFGVPMSPGLGLFLHKCVFDLYNVKLQSMGGNRGLFHCDDIANLIEEFKESQIYPQIAGTEKETKQFFEWARDNLFTRINWEYRLDSRDRPANESDSL